MTPLWDPYWEPFWKAASEVDLPVHFHTIGMPPEAPLPAELPEPCKFANSATKTAGNQMFIVTILASIIHGGALERYPNLRVVFGESGIGWIPYVLDRMDEEYENRYKGRVPLKSKPSDYWHRQCRATFQDDSTGVMLLEKLGAETVMWASDYPHAD